MSDIKIQRRIVRDTTDLDAIDPRVRAALAAFFKREIDVISAQTLGMPEHRARALAEAQLTDAERALLAKQAEAPERKLLEG